MSFHLAYLAGIQIGPCTTIPLLHTKDLRLRVTPHGLSNEVVDSVWDDGRLEYVGTRVVHHQGSSLRVNDYTIFTCFVHSTST